MKWKNKYLVGFTAISLMIASPITHAADDDEVIVFNPQIEDETVNNNVEVNETQTEDIQPETEIQNENETPTEEVQIENEIPNEVDDSNLNEEVIENVNDDSQSPKVEEINNEVEVEPLNEKYDLGNVYEEIEDTNQNNQNDLPLDDEVIEEIVEPYPIEDLPNDQTVVDTPKNEPIKNNTKNSSASRVQNQNQNNSEGKGRFVQLLSDDTYDYYLDRQAVQWIKLPYSTSEYMADVWIRMIEKNPDVYSDMPSDMYDYVQNDEIVDASLKNKKLNSTDLKILRTKKYYLEHYYIRPKTKQIQFLCELEVIGRPQNAIKERNYDYRNWENLIPGSVETSIYYGVLSEIGKGKSNKRGHMTFIDMVDEYARIALN